MPEKGLVKILTDKCSVASGRGGTKRHEECGGIVIEQKKDKQRPRQTGGHGNVSTVTYTIYI